MNPIRPLILIITILFSYKISAQVGINTLAPDSSAALDVQPPLGQFKGLLIPRMDQSQRINMPAPAKGLMVFDITDNLFYVNLSAGSHNWYALSPWMTKATDGTPAPVYTHSTVTNVGIGTSNPTARLDVNGSIKSNNVITAPTVSASVLTATTVTVPGFASNALVPTGAIMMWSGTVAPAGWALCDGGGGRPDLRGRFIVGYDAASSAGPATLTGTATANVTNYGAVGNRGGENAHIISTAEMAQHNHGFNDTHNINNPNGNEHHFFYDASSYLIPDTGSSTNKTTNDTGANQAHENRPPYYVLAYIIKLP